MRKSRIIIGGLIIGILLLAACTQKEENPSALPSELLQAEAIMYEHPDSALHILQKIKPAASRKLEHATWALLLTQANYKMYVKQSDSLLNIAYDYFIEREDAQRKALVLYCKSGLYGENNEVEKEQECLLQASNEVEKTQDYQLGYLIYSSLANLYVYRSLDDYALQTMQIAQEYALQSNNQDFIISSFIYIGRIYGNQEKLQKAINAYKKALNLSKESNKVEKQTISMSELSAIYICTKEYNSAISLIKEKIELSKKNKINNDQQSFLILGDAYRLANRIDSAYYYLNKSLISKKPHTLLDAYQCLYKLSLKEQKYKEATIYSDKLLFYQDSIQKLDKSRDLTEMQEKYNQQKIVNEKNQAKIESDKKIQSILIIAIALVCTIAVIVFIYQRILIRKERIIQENEEKMRDSKLKMQENERIIARNRSRMEELTAQMEANKDVQEHLDEQARALAKMQEQNELLTKENQILQKNIHHYSLSLEEVSKEISNQKHLVDECERLCEREKFLCGLLVKKTDELNTLKTAPKYLNEIQWEEVMAKINYVFNNFTGRLQKQIPSLTETDLRICCLIKLHLSNQNIATLTAVEPTSVSKQKQRLKERIAQTIGPLEEGQTLDLWLWDF